MNQQLKAKRDRSFKLTYDLVIHLYEAFLGLGLPALKETGLPIDRARALAARAELAVAMGDAERAQVVRAELQQIVFSDAKREQFRQELQAADDLERWLTQSER